MSVRFFLIDMALSLGHWSEESGDVMRELGLCMIVGRSQKIHKPERQVLKDSHHPTIHDWDGFQVPETTTPKLRQIQSRGSSSPTRNRRRDSGSPRRRFRLTIPPI